MSSATPVSPPRTSSSTLAACLILWLKPNNVNRYTFWIILTFAIACRLVGVFPDAFLSTDVYRYAWDGVVQHAGMNPYKYIANDPALFALRAPNIDLYDNMNRRDYAHTIYPPVAQVIFYLVTWISPTVQFMKLAMVLFEGLTLYGLILLLREFGLRREQALLYAWCPLMMWDFGASGHLDSVAMAFIVFALLFRHRERPVLVGVFLGLAFLTKFYPIVLFPRALASRRLEDARHYRSPHRRLLLHLPVRRQNGLRIPRRLHPGRGYEGRHPLLPAGACPTHPRPCTISRTAPSSPSLPPSSLHSWPGAGASPLHWTAAPQPSWPPPSLWPWRSCCCSPRTTPGT